MKRIIWLKIIFTDFLEMYHLNVPSQLRVNGIENIAWPGGSEYRWYSDKKGESSKKSTTGGGGVPKLPASSGETEAWLWAGIKDFGSSSAQEKFNLEREPDNALTGAQQIGS